MKAKDYTSQRKAIHAMHETAAMWPHHNFAVCVTGFKTWGVFLVRDGKPAIQCGALNPLPFTVTQCGTCVLFIAQGFTTAHAFPTHRRALNRVNRLRLLHVSPVEFVGPLQPYIARRVQYIARTLR